MTPGLNVIICGRLCRDYCARMLLHQLAYRLAGQFPPPFAGRFVSWLFTSCGMSVYGNTPQFTQPAITWLYAFASQPQRGHLNFIGSFIIYSSPPNGLR